MVKKVYVSGVEKFFDENDILVSKTDLKGRLTYVNKTFLEVSGYSEKECVGQPHSLIRHPDMPRCAFKILWDTIQSGKEVFVYVNNRAKDGRNYWVFAHVTPSFGADGSIIGYHSNRRQPDRDVLENDIIPLYQKLLAEEARHRNAKEGLAASEAILKQTLEASGLAYDEFIATLGHRRHDHPAAA